MPKLRPLSRLCPSESWGKTIFPMLLELEDPRSIASLSRVCKKWNAIMDQKFPYIVRMKFPDFLNQYPLVAPDQNNARELYLDHFPTKRLIGRMKRAYEKEQIYSGDFKAKVLPAILFGNPGVQKLMIKSFIMLQNLICEKNPQSAVCTTHLLNFLPFSQNSRA